ncbi:MAG: proton-conducting transporter membrane subunit [Nitrospinales bacterium]
MVEALALIPATLGIISFLIKGPGVKRGILVIGTSLHFFLVIMAWFSGGHSPAEGDWVGLDPLGLLFLGITSLIFFITSIYASGYLAREGTGMRKDFIEGGMFRNTPEQVFVGCYLLFLAAMTMVTVSQHLGLLWVAVEATTLASAPLIAFHRHHRALEAMWKYLIICSVGIALALLGTLTLGAIAGPVTGEGQSPLLLGSLLANADKLDPSWLKLSFILLLVGYGTKMGLAPFHTWLPDAHSEGPSAVSALLSGALLNVAFLGVLRAYQTLDAAGLAAFGAKLLIVFGLISMGFAAAFILRQNNFKRMLAYSSIEHMGIMAIGIGIGGAGMFGAAVHAINHSLIKAMLFLTAGNIMAHYKTTNAKEVPVSGVLWLIGFFAITGVPPFGLFVSEFSILKAALDGGYGATAAAYLFLLVTIFIAMAKTFFGMSQGACEETGLAPANPGEPVSSILPPIILVVCTFILGLSIPEFLKDALDLFAKTLGGGL